MWTEIQNKPFRIKISDIPASQFHLQVEIKLDHYVDLQGMEKGLVREKYWKERLTFS